MKNWLRKAFKEIPKRNERIEVELRPTGSFETPSKKHIFHEIRKEDPFALAYLPDEHIVKHSLVPAFFPSQQLPPFEEDLSIKETLGRRILKKMYQAFQEPYNMHRNKVYLDNRIVNDIKLLQPAMTYIAPSATVIGRVEIGVGVSIWPTAVLRADVGIIKVGVRTSIQDGAIITSTDRRAPDNYPLTTKIGNWVTVGHGAKIHAATIGDGAIIGMNATILEGAEIGQHAVIGAGAVIPPYSKIPPSTKWVGNPARCIGSVSYEAAEESQHTADNYVTLSRLYQDADPQSVPISLYSQSKAIADHAETLIDEEDLHDSRKDDLMHWDVQHKMKRNTKQADPNFSRYQSYFDRDLNRADEKTKKPHFKREDFLPKDQL